jgi:LacI family transcriptional regulator
MANATIRDVAAKAGVSIAAASYALNGGGRISDATRERVSREAAKLGYRPSPVALALRGTRAREVGIFMDEIGGPFFGAIMEGVQEVLFREGYGILAATPGPGGSDPIARLVNHSMISGAIILNPGTAGAELLSKMAERVPIVLFDAREAIPGCPRFGIQNQEGMKALMDHLIGHGFKDFAYLDGGPLSNDASERKRVFMSALKAAGLPLPKERVIQGSFKVQPAEKAAGELLDSGQRPRVIVSANDQMALGAMRAIHARGLRVPEDIAVTGFDDIEASAWTHPALTTVGYDRQGLGRAMAESLMEGIRSRTAKRASDPTAKPRGSARTLIPATLVLRQSCGTEKL